VVVVVALTTFVVFAFAALSADIGHLYSVSARLKAATDAAALAGVMGLKQSPERAMTLAKLYAARHQVDGVRVDLRDSDIRLGNWDFDAHQFVDLTGSADVEFASAVQVVAPRTNARGNPIAMMFAPILGYYTADVSQRSTASLGSGQPWDLVLVQDITGSFVDEIGDARDADQTMVDCVTQFTGTTSKMGLVAFTGVGQVMHTLGPLQDGGYEGISTTISKLRTCGNWGMPPCSGTNIAPGLVYGKQQLDAYGSPPEWEVGRAMILVSDGTPNPGGGSHATVAELEQLALDAADAAEAEGYSIWTVFYDEANNPDSQAFMAQLARGEGEFFVTPDSTDLPDLLWTICRKTVRGGLVE